MMAKKQPTSYPSQPFTWLLTQEHKILSPTKATEEKSLPLTQPRRFSLRPFTQVDFPTFTQLVADDEEISFKPPDPYKQPENPLELSELAWKIVQLHPQKDAILQDLVPVLESAHVKMFNGKFEIYFKTALESEPFKKTFLAKCPLLSPELSSSESSSDESSDSEFAEEMSMDEEEHPILLQEHQVVEDEKSAEEDPVVDTEEPDITEDLAISSSDEEVVEVTSEKTKTASMEEFPRPDLPSESQTQRKFGLDMPNLANTAAVATQTDLTMEDVEKLLRRKSVKEIQASGPRTGNFGGGDQQQPKRRKKSTVRIGLPRKSPKIKNNK